MDLRINDKQIQKVILNGNVCFNRSKDSYVADIFNHGETVGLHPAFLRYNIAGNWSYSTTQLTASWWDNGTLALGGYFMKGGFTKLKVEAEILNGRNGQYNISSLGIQYCKDGFPSGSMSTGNRVIVFTNYGNQTNYDHSTPWYNLPRQVCEYSLANVTDEPFYIVFHKCDCEPHIYSIWFE